jgi:hypothetical protein
LEILKKKASVDVNVTDTNQKVDSIQAPAPAVEIGIDRAIAQSPSPVETGIDRAFVPMGISSGRVDLD